MQPVQIKMARAALGLGAEDLAAQAGVSAATIADLEKGSSAEPEALQALNLFLASRGIELIDGDGVRATAGQGQESISVDELTTGNDGGEG